MNKTLFSTVGAAFMASLCCIGPALVLGSASLGFFTVFEPFRPILVILSLALLIFAYVKIFRNNRKDCCEPNHSRQTQRREKKFLLGITPLVFGLLLFPHFTGSIHDGEPNNPQGLKSEWIIKGMTCKGCAAGMEGALSALTGMDYCKVNYEEKLMICFTDEGVLSKDEIPEWVKRNGFTAHPKSEIGKNDV